MAKRISKQSLVSSGEQRLLPWKKVLRGSSISFSKRSKAGVVTHQDGAPTWFVFNTFALLDLLSSIDDAIADKLTTTEYHSKNANPAGWLIDEIESKLPVNPNLVRSLKQAVMEAERKGWIPFSSFGRG